MGLKMRLSRYWLYFKQGHTFYLAFLLSFANFIAIQYRLVVEEVAFLKNIFPDLAYFAIALLIAYPPAALLIGWYDYKRFSVPTDAILRTIVNPWTRDLARALMLIAEGRGEEAVKVLEKWAHGP